MYNFSSTALQSYVLRQHAAVTKLVIELHAYTLAQFTGNARLTLHTS